MRGGRRRTVLAAVLYMAILVGAGLPLAIGAPAATSAAPLPSLGGHAPSTAAPRLLEAQPLSPRPYSPHPTITCPSTVPPTPVYTTVGDLFPPTPLMTLQGPCNLVDEDEVHATLSSSAAQSGSTYLQPVWLPPDSSNGSQSAAYYQMYVGMIVSGNPDSEWRQSYAEVAFTPSSGSWTEEVAVWSLVNSSIYGGALNDTSADCPANSMWFSWNNSYYCDVDEASGNGFGVTVPGGSFLNVTFAGTVGGSTGLNVWVNDSTDTTLDDNFTFNSSATGSYTFEPFYSSSCLDQCLLHWGYFFGLGFGIFPMSYDEPLLRSIDPLTFGIPQFRTTSGYTGDYQYFDPESDSGACYTGGSPGAIANCVGFDLGSNTGYYPYFTFNGSEINFGADWPWTTVEWGGPGGEFFVNAFQHDIIPLSFYRSSNSSRAGFTSPNVPVIVNTTVQDLGTVTGVNLSYQLNGGSFTTVPMPRISGDATNGTYSVTIPGSLGNGLLNYSITASNHAGMTQTTPAFGYFEVRRGPLPTFHVDVSTNLLSCGMIEFNGTVYASGATVDTLPGYFPVFGVGCYPWNFTTWVHTGGVVLPGGFTTRTTTAEVYGNGTLDAQWTYIRPMDNITIATDPSTCGSVTIGNQTATNGEYVLVLDAANYLISQSGCGGYDFSGWTVSTTNLTILSPTLTPHGNGTLTATYVSSSVAVSLLFYTNPTTCGGVLYRGAGYSNGESLSVAPGSYDIAGDPCAHYGLREFLTEGAVSATNTTLTVNGSGGITEVNYHLTEITFVINPAACGAITLDGQNYTNGEVAVVQNNSTHLAFPVPAAGCYLIAFTADGGLTLEGNDLIANGSGNLTATFQTTPPNQVIAFLTDPSDCGTINFNNIPYQNSNSTSIAEGLSVTISATSCPGYGFVRWLTYGEITIVGSTAYINSSGAIEAVFEPQVELFLLTDPITCGEVVVNGIDYVSNSTLLIPELNTYTVGAIPCAGYAFVGWQNTTGVEVSGNSIFLLSGAFLTAVFTPLVYAVNITIDPASCGTVRLNGQSLGNGAVLHVTQGSYPLVAEPCVGDHLDHWQINGSLVLAGTTLAVNGSGNVTAFYDPVPPSVTISVPSSSLAGDGVELAATVAVLIPPFNYNYTWTFGDGTSLTTVGNLTTHTYSSPGTYTVRVEVRDPDNRTANASATITVLAASATQGLSFTTGELVGFGLVALALVAIAGVVVLRRRGDSGGSEGTTELASPSPSSPAPVTVSDTEQKP